MTGKQIQGCKLPRHLENPIDDLLMVLVEPLLGPLVAAGVTPNMVTWASAAAAAGSIAACFKGRAGLAAGLWVAGYALDIVDGFMARRYNMVTPYGDRLDHATDVLGYAGLIAFVAWRLFRQNPKIFWPLAVELLLVTGSLYHLQCQEKDTKELPISGVPGCACYDKKHLRFTRWAGMGTLMAWHVFLIWFYRLK